MNSPTPTIPFGAAFDALPRPVALIDDRGRCRFANAALAALAGGGAERLLGLRLDDILGMVPPGGEFTKLDQRPLNCPECPGWSAVGLPRAAARTEPELVPQVLIRCWEIMGPSVEQPDVLVRMKSALALLATDGACAGVYLRVSNQPRVELSAWAGEGSAAPMAGWDIDASPPWFATAARGRGGCGTGEYVFANGESRACAFAPIQVEHEVLGALAYVPTVGEEWRATPPIASALSQFARPFARALQRSRECSRRAASMLNWRQTIDNVADIVFVADRNFRFVACNSSCREFIGYSYEEIVGQQVQQLLGIDGTACSDGDGTAGSSILVLRNPKGKTAKCLLSSHRGREAVDREWTICFAKDVGSLKEIERQLSHSKLMENLGVLAGGVAHDFNNILAGILAHASHLERITPADDARFESISSIRRSAESGAVLTKQLRDFSSKGSPQRQPCSLHSVLQDAVGLMGRLLPREVRLQMQLASNDPVILATHSQLGQIVVNLCLSASASMPVGGTITISTRILRRHSPRLARLLRQPPGADHVCLSIADQGRGIVPEESEVDPSGFYRTSPLGGTTGLSLSIVYCLVDDHGGRIVRFSEPGIGTVFRILFPLVEPSPRPAFQEPFSPAAPATAAVGARNKVLVVDDDENVRSAISVVLKRESYVPILAVDGLQGLALFARHGRDLAAMVVDLHLPDMPGQLVIKQVRKQSREVPLVVCSGDSIDSAELKKLTGENAVFVHKPCAGETLLAAVRAGQRLSARSS